MKVRVLKNGNLSVEDSQSNRIAVAQGDSNTTKIIYRDMKIPKEEIRSFLIRNHYVRHVEFKY